MLDESRAKRAINFFEKVLKHTKGRHAGKPFDLIGWQGETTRDIFGNVDEDGNRLIQTVYLEIPKKNGKSEYAAGVALYCLVADKEPGAEVYSAAAAKDQAALVFKVAASMVEKSPMLSKLLRVIRSTKTIIKRDDPDSFYRAISADGDLQDGVNPHCVIADELHRWKVGKALDLWDVLTKGTIARSQPLVFAITTAGVQDESPLCWRYHEWHRQISEGIVPANPQFYSRVWGAGEKDDWTDPAVWAKANPSLETADPQGFLKVKALQKIFDEAISKPSEQAAFKRYHLNVWGQKENRWMDPRVWAGCMGGVDLQTVKLTLNELIEFRGLLNRKCYLGLDLSSTTDLTALTLVFPWEDGSVDVLPFFWMPEERVKDLELKCSVPFSQWVKDGFIEATEGNVIHYGAVEKRIAWAREMFEVGELGYDRWNAQQLIDDLVDAGLKCIEIKQNFEHMSPPMKRMMELALDKKLRHFNHPVLKWNADCVCAKGDGNDNIKPSKPNRSADAKRIDGMQSAFMGLGRSMFDETPKSKYETEEVFSVG